MSGIIDVSTVFGFWPRRQVDIRLETLLKFMDKHEIDKSWTTCVRGILIDVEGGNAETLAAAKKYPKSLVPVATIDPRCGGPVGDIVTKCVDGGFQHVRVFPEIQGWGTDSLVWQEILKALTNSSRLCLHLPAGMGLGPKPGLSFGAIDKIAANYPLPVVVHGSNFGQEPELAMLFARQKNAFAVTNRLIGVGALDRLARQGFGDRLLLGTNSPLDYPASGLGVARAAKDDDLRTKILSGNALSIMEQLA